MYAYFTVLTPILPYSLDVELIFYLMDQGSLNSTAPELEITIS